MNIGFAMKWSKGLHLRRNYFIGEEQYAESLCNELMQIDGVKSARLYAPDLMPVTKLDVMIHLNETVPGPFARRHILYMQNYYPQGSDVILKHLEKFGYDGYAFVSNRLLELHKQQGYNGIYLPLAADTAIYNPRFINPKYEYDVAYVGNDIKGEKRTMQYIYPAVNYNFGLFGRWPPPTDSDFSEYRSLFANLSKGAITREEQAVIYSSAKIILNCTGQDSVNWDALNLRFFEVLACKGFLVSDKLPSAEHEFKDSVIFTDGGTDLLEKIDYYLARPKERKEIAENGYRYVVQKATVKVRARQLYDYLEEVMSQN